MKDPVTMIQVVEELTDITSIKELQEFIRNAEIDLAYTEAEIAKQSALDAMFDRRLFQPE